MFVDNKKKKTSHSEEDINLYNWLNEDENKSLLNENQEYKGSFCNRLNPSEHKQLQKVHLVDYFGAPSMG